MAALPPDRRPEILAQLKAAVACCLAETHTLWRSDDLPLTDAKDWTPEDRLAVDRLDRLLAHVSDAVTAMDTLELLDTQERCRGR